MHLSCYKSKPSSELFTLVNLLSLKINFSIEKKLLIQNLISIPENNNTNDNNNLENKHKNHFIKIIINIVKKVKNIVGLDKIINFIENNYFLVSISSEIPVGFGLGSSAAYNVCIVNGLCLLVNKLLKDNIYNKKEILLLSNESEKIFHNGTPSGIDASCSLYGGVIIFNSLNNQKNIDIPTNNFFNENIKFILINTKIQRNGGEFIKNVSNFKKNNPILFNDLINKIGEVTNNIIKLILKDKNNEEDCEKFLRLITLNQELLKKICVSNDEIDRIINLLEKNGFSGKISGAGGGGFIICFALKEKIDALYKLLNDNKIEYINVNISKEPANLINYKLYKL